MRKQVISLILAMLMCVSVSLPAAAKKETAEIKLETVCDAIYDEIGDFHDGYAPAKKDGKWGVIDEKGKLVVKAKYDWMADVHEGTVVAAIADKKEQYTLYLVDMKGKAVKLKQTVIFGDQSRADSVVLSKDKLNTSWGCHDGIVWVSDYAYLPDGSNIHVQNYEKLFGEKGFSGYKTVGCHGDDGKILMFGVMDNGGYVPFVMDVSGKVVSVVQLPKYDKKVKSTQLLCYDNGYILVKCKVEEGDQTVTRIGVMDTVMDTNRDYIIPPIYDSYQYEPYTDSFIYDDTIKLVKDGKVGIVDLEGNIIIPFEYDSLVAFMDEMACGVKREKIGNGSLYIEIEHIGYVDKAGTFYTVATLDGGVAKHINLSSFYQGLASVFDYDAQKWYLITKHAKDGVLQPVPGSDKLSIYVFFPDYDKETGLLGSMRLAEEMVNGPIKIKENDKWGLKRLVNLPITTPETTAPVTTVPAPETTAPTPETTAPAPETTAPAPETTAPAPETTAPAPETTAPAPETTVPAPETAAPAPETTVPAPETTAPAPESSPYKPGTPIGDVLYSNIVAYIDGYAIPSYNIAGNTYIVVEDLMNYGFDVQWIAEGTGRLVVGTTRTATPDGYTTTYVAEQNTHPAGTVAMPYLYTEITTWIGDQQVTGYNIGGYTCICIDDLAAVFSESFVWDADNDALRMTTKP